MQGSCLSLCPTKFQRLTMHNNAGFLSQFVSTMFHSLTMYNNAGFLSQFVSHNVPQPDNV